MGRPKLLLDWDGRPVIRATVDRLREGPIDDVVVVVGPDGGAIAAALAGTSARVVVNPHPEAGQGSSIAAGVTALAPDTEAALVCLGDQPTLPPDVVPALVERFRESGAPVVRAGYLDGPGPPTLFAAAVLPELAALAGDRGARAVVERDPARVSEVRFPFARPGDLDTPEDWAGLRPRGSGPASPAV